jgi:DMSO reductase anchor subunit
MMAERLHEWPLVLFTTLVVGGAGLLAASALAGDQRSGLAALAALGLGFAVSLAHLGRPLRAPLAVRRAGQSRLSDEIVAGGATWLCGAAWLLAASHHAVGPAVATAARTAALAAPIALLVVVGLLYRLPAQQTWRGWATVAPAVAGLAFGVVAVTVLSAAPAPPWVTPAAAWLVVTDAALTLARWRGLQRHRTMGVPVHEAIFARRHVLLAARLALFDAVPILLAAGLPTAAGSAGPVAVMAAGLLLDRLLFYGLAVRRTTQAELMRAERAIERLGH